MTIFKHNIQSGPFSTAVAVAMLCSALMAVTSVSAQPTLQSCADVVDSDARLSCYDQAMKASQSQNLPVLRLPRNSAPASASNSDTQPATVQEDDFGLELKRSNRPESDSRTLRVSSARHNDFTGWTITFENGQIWKQVGTDDYDVDVGVAYTISRATLNSFFLSNSENSRKIRITRVE